VQVAKIGKVAQKIVHKIVMNLRGKPAFRQVTRYGLDCLFAPSDQHWASALLREQEASELLFKQLARTARQFAA
jgi:hypothetical protein